ncbi:hypothetical protein A2U01_0049018, partial [Trifolium medium]|nr:hypothetical protein [Trifolium medium]
MSPMYPLALCHQLQADPRKKRVAKVTFSSGVQSRSSNISPIRINHSLASVGSYCPSNLAPAVHDIVDALLVVVATSLAVVATSGPTYYLQGPSQ